MYILIFQLEMVVLKFVEFSNYARVVARHCVLPFLIAVAANSCYRNCTCNACKPMQGLHHNAVHLSSITNRVHMCTI